MRKSAKVDRYLRQLERELADMPAEARDGVLRDVKAQIKKELARDKRSSEILRDLGAPKLIAMSHMKVRCSEKKTSPWVRWTAAGTVGFFAVILVGGLAWILGNTQNVKAKGAPDALGTRALVGGSFDLAGKDVKRVVVKFNVGKLVLENAPDGVVKWVCAGEPRLTLNDRVLDIHTDQEAASCELAIPERLATRVAAANGHLDIRQPRYPLEIELANGRVSLAPEPGRAYDYQVHVKNGLQDFFRRSVNPRAIKVKIDVLNGTVKKE